MTLRLFISGDWAARALGADRTAAALTRVAAAHGEPVEIVRVGSRGLTWIEPLVECEMGGQRQAFGPIGPDDAAGLLAALSSGRNHPAALGNPAELPYLAGQTRLTFARAGLIAPLAPLAAPSAEFAGLRRALSLGGEAAIAEVERSGLRGRGGAGFPAAIKLRTVRTAADSVKYIVCNADEGDSGTFADRMLMESDPLLLIEGMIIAGIATGATQGFLYIRSEYPHSVATMRDAVDGARRIGLLGPSVLGSDKAFDVTIRVGAGAYICGEETALLESLEGRRGMVRAKPPLPALVGLFGRPTLVNNVLTLAALPTILEFGGEAYASYGTGRSRGTMPFQLAGNIRHAGLVEVPFGITLGELVEGFGGGSATGRPIRAVQIGGPLGAYFPRDLFGVSMDYESLAQAGGMLGHGGIVAFDDTVDLSAQARFAMEFCALESCGKCTPCRIGSTRGAEVIDRIRAGQDRARNLAVLEDLCETMEYGSLCALGGLTPLPVRSAIKHFLSDFGLTPATEGAA